MKNEGVPRCRHFVSEQVDIVVIVAALVVFWCFVDAVVVWKDAEITLLRRIRPKMVIGSE
jgi:hypothetical protein